MKSIRRNSLILRMVAAVFVVATINSCIKNDTPPLSTKGVFDEFEVEGQKKRVSIEDNARTVTIDLYETVDPRSVTISKLTVRDGGVCELQAGMVLDLSSPVKTVIRTVANYEWTISATQTIDRRFVIEGQVGETSFEENSCNAFAYVPRGTDMTKINVIELKLGPEGKTTMTPELIGEVDFEGSNSGLTKMREVEVSYRDVTEVWSLFITQTDTQLTKVHPFAGRVYLSAFGRNGHKNGFEYKLAGENRSANSKYADSEPNGEGGWIRVPDSDVEHNGGVFTTCIKGLTAETEYLVKAFSGDDHSLEQSFTTEGIRSLPDGSFDQWHLDGKLWNPWVKDGTQWWDTGNKGAATLGNSNSLPTEAGEGCPSNPGGKAAYLETRFVGIGGIGKIAGGNIYFGKYAKTVGTNGLCDIGRAWQHKPTKMKGYYKYFPKPITDVGTLQQDQKDHFMGSTDSLNICVALWASPDGREIPFTVNTIPAEFVDFSRNAPGVIAFGNFANPDKQSEWGEFSIDLDYFDTGKLPKNTVLFIMATASKNCNYFTAGRGSLMYLDELELVYD